MVRPKKTKLTEVSNQQRITSFFSSIATSSQSVKRSPQHNVGVSPNAKRNSNTTTSGKEDDPYPCKRDLSDDLESSSPQLSYGQLRSVPQANGKVCSGGLTGNDSVPLSRSKSASQTKKSPDSHPTAGIRRSKQKGKINNRRGSQVSSLLRKSLSAQNGSLARLSGKCNGENEEEEVILLSDSDVYHNNELENVNREEKALFSLSDSSQDAWLTPENLHKNNESSKLHRGKDKETQSTSSSSSEELCSTPEVRISNNDKEEETSALSDCSEDLFSSPLKTKPKKDFGMLLNDKVASWSIAMKQDYAIVFSSDDEVTSESSQRSQHNGESKHSTSEGSEIIMESSHCLKPLEECPDDTPDTTKNMLKSSQDSSNGDGTDETSDITTDILKASQEFRVYVNATDNGKDAATGITEDIQDCDVNTDGTDGTLDTLKIQNGNREESGKLSEEENLECHSIPDLSPLKEDSKSKQVPVLNREGTPDAPETENVDGKVSRKLSEDEEMDCLNILEMFGELSPFKERPSSRPVHGLLKNDPIVKKFLDEGQGKESFAAQGNFGRHLVLVAERDSSARTIHLELLSPENVKRTCTLAGLWSDTVVRDGDIIHILLTQPVDGHYHIDDNQGLAVVHPDLLVSSTSVASGVFCRRRAVLAEWHRGMESTSAVMMLGSLVHELFQEAVVEAVRGGVGVLSDEKLQSLVSHLLGRPKVLQELYRLGPPHTMDSLREDVASFIPQVVSWCSRYLEQDKQRLGIGSYKWQGRITDVEEVEENIWSPQLGLKGKVDMVVRAECSDGPVILPLELKTGRASFSAEHRGQLALYAMMTSDRRPDPRVGLLLYLREGAMEAMTAPARERRDLIRLRNDLASHLAARPEASQAKGREPSLPTLPPPIAHERGCQQCPHKVTCAVHQILQGDVPVAPHPMAFLVPQSTDHLSTQHLDYFRHWCLLYQLEAAESFGGGGALWCRDAVRREKEGECLAWLVLGATPVEVRPGVFLHTLVRGHRHPSPATPLASVGLQAGDQVIASSTKVLALACGSVQGFREGVVLAELDRPLEGGIAHHYHLDLHHSTSFLRLPMQTLGRLLLPEPRAEALRRLVVDKTTPVFKKRVPSKVLACRPMLSHLNSAQKRAVIQALAAEDYMVVQGFPGTGKSSTLATMVRVLMQLNRSVLITAYTNTALDSLLLKLHNLGIDFMRVGRADRVHPDLASHTEEARSGHVCTVEELTELYASQHVVAATCLGLSHPIFSRRTFDVCIVDEAAQVLQVTALGPLFVCSSFVLVGDDKQLPPVVRSECAVLHGMTETLFERLYQPEVTVTLTEQYRMNGPIMTLANRLTYNNLLTCGRPELEKATLDLPHYQRLVEEGVVAPWLQRVVAPTLDESVVFVDTAGGAHEARVSGSSLTNLKEAKLVIMVVKTLLKAGLSAGDIGIITPYRGQVKLVKTLLAQEVGEEEAKGKRVEVNTVDQYQGRDKMAIICTFVRCGKTNDKPAGILTDRRRLNVALTRAKRKLILLGDRATLTRYHAFSCLMDVLTPHQMYCVTPGIDEFLWEEGHKDM